MSNPNYDKNKVVELRKSWAYFAPCHLQAVHVNGGFAKKLDIKRSGEICLNLGFTKQPVKKYLFVVYDLLGVVSRVEMQCVKILLVGIRIQVVIGTARRTRRPFHYAGIQDYPFVPAQVIIFCILQKIQSGRPLHRTKNDVDMSVGQFIP